MIIIIIIIPVLIIVCNVCCHVNYNDQRKIVHNYLHACVANNKTMVYHNIEDY